MKRHRRVAYHGLTYWITWVVVAAGLLAGLTVAFLVASLVAAVAFALLVALCILIAVPTAADAMGRLAERSSSPREQAKSLWLANVDLVREVAEERAAHAVTVAVLDNERARIAAQDADIRRLRQELDHADREIWRLRDAKRGIREYQAPLAAPAEVTAVLGAVRDPDATMAHPAVPSAVDNAETAVLRLPEVRR